MNRAESLRFKEIEIDRDEWKELARRWKAKKVKESRKRVAEKLANDRALDAIRETLSVTQRELGKVRQDLQTANRDLANAKRDAKYSDDEAAKAKREASAAKVVLDQISVKQGPQQTQISSWVREQEAIRRNANQVRMVIVSMAMRLGLPTDGDLHSISKQIDSKIVEFLAWKATPLDRVKQGIAEQNAEVVRPEDRIMPKGLEESDEDEDDIPF